MDYRFILIKDLALYSCIFFNWFKSFIYLRLHHIFVQLCKCHLTFRFPVLGLLTVWGLLKCLNAYRVQRANVDSVRKRSQSTKNNLQECLCTALCSQTKLIGSNDHCAAISILPGKVYFHLIMLLPPEMFPYLRRATHTRNERLVCVDTQQVKKGYWLNLWVEIG